MGLNGGNSDAETGVSSNIFTVDVIICITKQISRIVNIFPVLDISCFYLEDVTIVAILDICQNYVTIRQTPRSLLLSFLVTK